MTARTRHSGINATRDVLKDQLVLAADTIISQRERLDWWDRNGVAGVWSVSAPGVWAERLTLRARLARWVRRAWA